MPLQPQPPSILSRALEQLQERYPLDRFEPTMRYTAVSGISDEPITLQPGAPPPPGTKYCYYPRIRCNDCPGKLYTPDATLGTSNFEVHLRNRKHRDLVMLRMQREDEEAGQTNGGAGQQDGADDGGDGEEGEIMDD